MSDNYNFQKNSSIKNSKRKGRGNASGNGGEAGRGHKGQKSRSGYSKRAGFEGGQMPLYKRTPKLRGLGNLKKSNFNTPISLDTISKHFSDNDVINLITLSDKGICKKFDKVKFLNGDLKLKGLTFEINSFSSSALKVVESMKSVIK